MWQLPGEILDSPYITPVKDMISPACSVDLMCIVDTVEFGCKSLVHLFGPTLALVTLTHLTDTSANMFSFYAVMSQVLLNQNMLQL